MDFPGAQFLLERCLAYAVARDPVERLSSGEIARAKRILIAVTTGMGDAILASPVVESVRAAAADADIRLFCRAAWKPLFSGDSRLNGVIPYYGKFRRFFRTLAELRRFSPDLILAPHINDPDILPMLYFSGSRKIVRVPWGSTRHCALLSNKDIEGQRFGIPGLHVVDERLRVVEVLGIPVVSRVPHLEMIAAAVQGMIARAQEETGCSRYAVLHIYSVDAYRTIPEDLARASLAAIRVRFPELGWVLTGSAIDRKPLQALAKDLGTGIWAAAGKLSVAETAACVAGARAIIAPDTGVLHMAAALDRPLLALLSPTPEAPTRAQLVGPRTASAPVRILEVPSVCDPCVGRRCPFRPVACLQAFRVDDVVEQFQQLLRPASSDTREFV